jgi:branched-chain amino acid transport system ATP-binding protein
MLVVEDLTVHYGRVAGLRGVSLEVNAGELVGTIGPNGAGKSTLLMTIAGVRRPTSGQIFYDGESITKKRPEEIVSAGISIVPERRRIFTRLTVHENLQLGTTVRRDRTAAAADIKAALERFPILKERLDASASTLSGGEQQQLAIARALLSRPRLLLVDEPSLGLAPRMVDLIFETLEGLRKDGVTILLVEQNALQTMRASDRAYVLRNGRVELQGSGDELIERTDIWSTYFGRGPGDGSKHVVNTATATLP